MARAWCKNYHGMHEKTECGAGVSFASLPGKGKPGFFDTCPCFGRSTGCDKAEYPTADELAAAEVEMERRIDNIGKARTAIVSHCGGPWKRGDAGKTGVIDCPACGEKGNLHFSRAGYNGHIRAKCQTKKCVSWME